MMPAVAIDARWFGDHGIGRFVRNVAERIPFRHIAIHGRPASPVSPLSLALGLLRERGVELFYSPGYVPPLHSSIPYVITIHDLNHLDVPENSSYLKRMFYETVLKPGARRAAAILSVSEFSRRRIIDWLAVAPETVTNVGNGVESAFHAGVQPYSCGFPYFLVVGNRKPHKNEARIIEAFASADIPNSCRLLLTGEPSNHLLSVASAHSISDRVSFLGAVEDRVLPSLYKGAVALLFPSLYEGFGLPVIEAMACGTPVLTSTATALPEIAGDAALLVDARSTQEISRAIEQLAQDSVLREQLSQRGLRRAALYSWDATAAKVRTVLEGVLGRPIADIVRAASPKSAT